MDVYDLAEGQDVFNQFLAPEYSSLHIESPDSDENTRDPGTPSWSSDTPQSPDADMATASFGEDVSEGAPAGALFGENNNSTSLYANPDDMIVGMFGTVKQLTAEEIDSLANTMSLIPVEVKTEDPEQMDVEPAYGTAVPVFHPDMLSDGFSDGEDSERSDDESSSAKKKRPRKKRKSSASRDESVDSIPEDVSKLNRDQLLALSSKGFEEYARRLQQRKDLTSEEKKELKRQRRLIKNRESAQASRQRKKSYIEKLEAKVAALTTTNAQLRDQITNVQKENGSLKQEVAYLQGMLKKTPGLTQLFTSGINYVAGLAKQDAIAAREPQHAQHNAPVGNNVKAAGVCLLVLLFSFGLFFPSALHNNNNKLPIDMNTRESALEALPSTTRLFSNNQGANDYRTASTSRTLMSVLSEKSADFNTERLQEAYQRRVSAPRAVISYAVEQIAANASSAPSTDKMEVDEPRVEVTEKSVPPAVVTTQFVQETQPACVVHTSEQSLNATSVARVVDSIRDWKANTTYLVCGSVQHLTPPKEALEKADKNTPMTISFIIPPESLAQKSSSSSTNGAEIKQLLEVSCQVLGVNAIPIKPSVHTQLQFAQAGVVESPA